jgi:hypothetical protein
VIDVATKLASRLERTRSDLAIVLSIHLFAEHLLDLLIDAKSVIAARIRSDRRTYTFAVKLALARPLAPTPLRQPRRAERPPEQVRARDRRRPRPHVRGWFRGTQW